MTPKAISKLIDLYVVYAHFCYRQILIYGIEKKMYSKSSISSKIIHRSRILFIMKYLVVEIPLNRDLPVQRSILV